MVRKLQLQPRWGEKLPNIELPNQPMVSGESGPVHVGRAFFESFPAHPETSVPPQLKVTLRFILPDDPATSDTASPAIIAGYKLQITNDCDLSLIHSSSATGQVQTTVALLGDSITVSVGDKIGWTDFSHVTTLVLSSNHMTDQRSSDAALVETREEHFASASRAPTNAMEVDAPNMNVDPSNYTSGAIRQLVSQAVPALALGTPSLADRNPLREQLMITPHEGLGRHAHDPPSAKVKTEPTSPRSTSINSPRNSSATFRDPAPTSLKSKMPNSLHDLSTTSGAMVSPRSSGTVNMPTAVYGAGHLISQNSGAAALASAPLGMPTPLGNLPQSNAHFGLQPGTFEAVLLSNPMVEKLRAKHASELEQLLLRHQLEVASLVASHTMEFDAVMRGTQIMPASNAGNVSLISVLRQLLNVSSNGSSPSSRPGSNLSSEDVDVVGLDDTSAWRTNANHQTKPKKTTIKAPKPSAPSTHSTSHVNHSANLPSTAPATPSGHHHHNHSTSTPEKVHHHQHQHLQQPSPNSKPAVTSTHHSSAASSASNSESEEDSSRRTQRKRKLPLQSDYMVDDKEMEQILGIKKKRAERDEAGFPVPVAVSAPPPVLAPAQPHKKPKPRDNVAIATILDIYSPLKSTLPPWKYTFGSKTLILYHTDCLDHVTPEWHLESPNRLKAVMESIQLVNERYGDFCMVMSNVCNPADLAIVRQCHQESYIKKITSKVPANRAMPPLHATQDIDLSLSMSTSSGLLRPPMDPNEPTCEPPKDTFVSFGSWNAALLAAGAVIDAVDKLFTEPQLVRNAFCGVRPPGHHAGAHGHDGAITNGYCILNSVAIGAKHAFNKYNLKKIAILDFDVHQGNGTAQIVEDDDRILFISLHGSEIYPFSEATKADADACTERVINIGYPNGTNGKAFMELFLSRCKQLLIDFQPELILLSSGFDAHIDDPTGAGMLRFADYVALTRVVKEIADSPSCQGRIISVLEGGYDIRALKLSVAAHLLALMEGAPAPSDNTTFLTPYAKALPAISASSSQNNPSASSSSSSMADDVSTPNQSPASNTPPSASTDSGVTPVGLEMVPPTTI